MLLIAQLSSQSRLNSGICTYHEFDKYLIISTGKVIFVYFLIHLPWIHFDLGQDKVTEGMYVQPLRR